MEEWDNEPRVKPVPIEGDERPSTDEPSSASGPNHWTRRPWLPIALSSIATLGVLASVAFFGAIEHDDPPPALDTRRFTNVRALQEIIPDITDRVTLIVVGPQGPATMLWDPSLVEPKIVDPWSKDEEESVYVAAFDSGGRFVVLASTPIGSERMSLRIGIPTDLGSVDLEQVDTFQWHATEIGRLAFVQTDASGDATLHTALVNPFSRTLVDVVQVGLVPSGTELVRWDSKGFILTGGQQGTVQALHGSGADHWSEPGHAHAVSGNTILISPSSQDATLVTALVAFTRDGERLETVLNEPVGAEVAMRTMTLSRNSDLSARVEVVLGVTTLKVDGPQMSSSRVIEHDGDGTPLGFTSNDELFVLKSTVHNDLIFMMWDSGAVYELDIPDGFDVIAIDIG